jgi:hypothetical protein
LKPAACAARLDWNLPCTRKALSVDLFFSLPATAGFFVCAPVSDDLAARLAAPAHKKTRVTRVSSRLTDDTAPGRDDAAGAADDDGGGNAAAAHGGNA